MNAAKMSEDEEDRLSLQAKNRTKAGLNRRFPGIRAFQPEDSSLDALDVLRVSEAIDQIEEQIQETRCQTDYLVDTLTFPDAQKVWSQFFVEADNEYWEEAKKDGRL